MKKYVRTTGIIITLIFACIGVLFTTVFIGMRMGLFNVRGAITERNTFFKKHTSNTKPTERESDSSCIADGTTVCSWDKTPEWLVVKGGLEKDADIIYRVANETQVHPRIIASIVVPEQIRFFTAEREVFKRYFEPLKILGSLSQFSLGVSGIKQETAEEIEFHANNSKSSLYPGEHIASLLAYTSQEEKDKQLYERLTDAKNHYYSYLYTGAYIKEIISEWERSGYDISKNAGILTTLFNLGFDKSEPKDNPMIGGAEIEVGGKTYTYGELGELFYSSSELEGIFQK